MRDSRRPLTHLERLARDRRGVAAIEFALIVPLLVVILFGSITVFQYFRFDLQQGRATSMMGDLLSRQTSVSQTFLKDRVVDGLEALLPVGVSPLEVRVTSLVGTGSGTRIQWSYTGEAAGDFAGRPIPRASLPEVARDDTIIVIETSLAQAALVPVANLGQVRHRHLVAARPRFTRAIGGPD